MKEIKNKMCEVVGITSQMHADQAADNIDSLAVWRVIWGVSRINKQHKNSEIIYCSA